MGGQVEDADAAHLAVQQLAQRHAAGTSLGKRHDDFVDTEAPGGFEERSLAGHQLGLGNDRLLLVRAAQVANDLPSEGRWPQRLADQLGRSARAVDQECASQHSTPGSNATHTPGAG